MPRLPILILVALLCACEQGAEAGGAIGEPTTRRRAVIQDPAARELHATMLAALAPHDGWERTQYLEFDWVLSSGVELLRRSHRFAPNEGHVRVEAPVDGRTMVALVTTAVPEAGRVWLDGTEVVGDSAVVPLLTRAIQMFEIDAYWLLMPYLWAEPGTRVRRLPPHEAEVRDGEAAVEITFRDVGGPEPKYRVFLDVESGLIARWQIYRLETDPRPEQETEWAGWRRFGPLLLSTERLWEGDSRIDFDHIRVEELVPWDRLTGPNGERLDQSRTRDHG